MSDTILEEEAQDDKPENDHYPVKVELVCGNRHNTAQR
jgi:hypothetical protein